jgi:2-octaprenyl-3-methyl-6-methoxy-1,4-benzoquinol hydroxylase/2-octaprenylphenol hydroxylase
VQLEVDVQEPRANSNPDPERLAARLVVAADGAHSLVRAAAGIAAVVEDYQQVAVVVHLSTDRPATGVAYERFTPTGPLAVLPLVDGRYTVVWTLSPERARQVLALDDAALWRNAAKLWLAHWSRAAGRRSRLYPLGSAALRRGGRRAVLVGNAAQACTQWPGRA